MIKGLDPKSETYKDTKKMLFSLNEILSENDPTFMQSRQSYQEFLNNPSLEKKKVNKGESICAEIEYQNNIRFIEHNSIEKNKNNFQGAELSPHNKTSNASTTDENVSYSKQQKMSD